jgi:hypothetical protein
MTTTKPKPVKTDRIARGRPMAVARAVVGAAGPTFSQFGFKRHEILTSWALIVGDPLASFTLPVRIIHAPGGATVVIRVDGGAALEIQHMAPQILERINSFLGGPVVARIKLVQGSIPKRFKPAVKPDRALSPEETGALSDATHHIADQKLRESLVALGRRILQDKW